METLETLFENYFRPSTVVAPFSASFGAPTYVNPAIGVRVIWRFEHPDEVFDNNDPVHVLQIKVIYQNNNWNWQRDPLFKEQPAPST